MPGPRPARRGSPWPSSRVEAGGADHPPRPAASPSGVDTARRGGGGRDGDRVGNRIARRRQLLVFYLGSPIRQLEAQVDEALRQALTNVGSVPAPAREMIVVLGPGWPGVMLHEAVGHGLEGDFNRKKTSTYSGRAGQRSRPRRRRRRRRHDCPIARGTLDVDDEGTRTGPHLLIEDGILKGYMQGPAERPLHGRPADRQRTAREPRPCSHPAHDQHHPAVLDQVGLGGGKHELARRDVDLPPPKLTA